ncbi:MAG TPA: hypothetical protein VME23_10540 [Terracidiphilus sp.]|nr:hypothetical protein [Terracidiphilus sp.]
MERMLATPADAEIILKLYQLRTEETMRKARAWLLGDFWPKTADEFFAVQDNPGNKHNPWLRQVVTYWEMAAAMVLHGAVSAELFVDCNAEGFYILAKFAPILDAIRERYPTYLAKTSDMVKRFSSAAQRYRGIKERVEASRAFHAAKPKKRAPREVSVPDQIQFDVPAS